MPPGPLTAETILDAVADSARFDVMQLGEAAMRGQTARALRILEGLRGEDVDIGARIFAVVDAFDAMVSDRVYRRGCSYEAALEELERCAGTQFDPVIVEAFKQIPKEDWEILRERSLADKHEIYSFQAVVAELVYSRNQLEMVH